MDLGSETSLAREVMKYLRVGGVLALHTSVD